MKKFNLLTKTLLVAVLLCVGANAWADATVTLTSSYAVDNYAKSFYINFIDKTIDDGSTYNDVISLGDCTQRTGYGVQNQKNSARSFTISKSISKGDLLILQVGQTDSYGISVSVGSAVSNPIKNDGYLAFYATADAASISISLGRLNYIAAMQVLSPSNTTYIVNAVTSNGTLLKQIATGEFSAEGTVYYPYGVMKDGVCYVKAKNGEEPYWGFTNVAAGLRTIVYTANEWAYYSEMEDMNGASLGGTRYSLPGRASYGGWQYMNNNARMYSSNLSAGTYSITVYGRNNKKNSQTPPEVIIRYSDGTYSSTVATFDSWDSGNTAECTVNNVVIPEGCAFCLFQKDYSSNIDLDYVYAVKTSDDAKVSGTITDAGWSTFASPYKLDLSTVTATSGATAYYASEATGSTVTLTSTTAKVPAGEGLMIKGTAGETFTIGVAASGTSISGNLLKGQTTTGDVTASGSDGKYHYVFGYESSSVYGFYNLTEDTSVSAGKAYLETTTALSAGLGARAIGFVVDDDILTGIEQIENGEVKSSLPVKRIVNGKLVIEKKGMMFNAAGAKLY